MSKDCGNHGEKKIHWWKKKKYRRAAAWVAGILVLILFAILVTWLVLRPMKPRFYLQDATVSAFNQSSGAGNLLTTSIQVTVTTRNPNSRIGVYYDKLDIYASYKYQQITLHTAIPPTYQGHKDVVIWSPYLFGTNVPIAPFLAASLGQDKNSGMLLLDVKLDGKLRWKVGSWTSGKYHVFVNCPALLVFGSPPVPGYWPLIRFQQMSACEVDV
ncbi:NDR1/HIN1-like protein 1 [Wolffia australiana]